VLRKADPAFFQGFRPPFGVFARKNSNEITGFPELFLYNAATLMVLLLLWLSVLPPVWNKHMPIAPPTIAHNRKFLGCVMLASTVLN